MTDIAQLERDLLAAVGEAKTERALEDVRVSALGKKGAIAELLKTLGSMSPDERKIQGRHIQRAARSRRGCDRGEESELENASLDTRLSSERVDVSLPAPEAPRGTVHPVSQVKDEVTAIFADLGFAVAEGPDVESDDYNFTKLNIPPEHPARQMHDTFYMKPQSDGSRPLLRTHTSPVQVRTMLAQKPPIRIIAPGRTYRHDSDATHSPMFHQVEALVIDEETHLGHLKWLIEEFCKAFFEVSPGRDALPAVLFPVHRALDGSRHAMRPLGRRAEDRRRQGLARDRRLRHGASARARDVRHRSRALSGLRVRHSASTAWRC